MVNKTRIPALIGYTFTGHDRQQNRYVKYIACYAMTNSKKGRRAVKYREPGKTWRECDVWKKTQRKWRSWP